jgi:hypothetical protein
MEPGLPRHRLFVMRGAAKVLGTWSRTRRRQRNRNHAVFHQASRAFLVFINMRLRKDSAQLGEEHGTLEKEVTDTRKPILEGNRATGTG